jgi:protein TonB
MKCFAAACAVALSLTSIAAQQVYKTGNGVTTPVVIHQVNPDYTPDAKKAHIQGNVVLNVVVNADGGVGDVTVSRSLDSTFGLDEQAVKAAKEWKFKPGTKDGKPVAVQVAVELWFTLK